jgi:hypothetical protein
LKRYFSSIDGVRFVIFDLGAMYKQFLPVRVQNNNKYAYH